MAYYDDEDEPLPESIWQRVNRWLWALLVLTVIVIIVGAFLPELQKQKTERAERERLHRLIEEQKMFHARYTRQITWLQNDPEYLGIIARDRLNLMKEGESILIVEPPKTPAIEPENPAPTLPRRDVAPSLPPARAPQDSHGLRNAPR